MGLNLVTMAEKMKRKDKEIAIDHKRGVALIDCSHSPISQRKAETALYKMAGEGDFYNMAINNNFNSPLLPSVSRKLIEYKPIVNVGEICIYSHKSNGMYYVSATIQHSAPTYTVNDTQLEFFRLRYTGLVDAFYSGRIEFESNVCQLLFMTYYKMLS